MFLYLLAAADTDQPATLRQLETLFSRVVSAAVSLSVIALFVMLLIGGFKFLTSGGDPKALEGAKKTLTYAIGGLVLITLSYLIMRLIQEVTGANITTFSIFKSK